MKRFIWSALLVLGTLVGLVLLWQFRQAVILFAFSLATAAAVRPATDFFVERGLGRGLAISLTYVIGLVFLGGLFYLVGGSLLREFQQGTDSFAKFYENITTTWPNGTPFMQAIAAQLPPPEDLYRAIAGDQGSLLIQNVLGVAQGLLTVISQLAIVLVLSVYWSADRVHFERLWLSLLPVGQRARARTIWRSMESRVGAYIRSELAQSLLAGLLLGAGYWLMRLPYPALLAFSGALLWLIPWLGAILALVLPLIAGLSISPLFGFLAGIYSFGVLLALEVLVEPRLFDRRRYSSLLVVLVLVALADAYGLVGLIFAPPLAAAIQILFTNLERLSAQSRITATPVQIKKLRERLAELREKMPEMAEPPAPELVNMMNRLSSLIEETGEFFEEEQVEEPSLDLPPASDATPVRMR